MNIQSETEADVLRGESIEIGNNPPGVISETDTPSHLVFNAADGHDFHVRTQITVENPADTSQTEEVTVTLSESESASGAILASSTEELQLDAFEVRTVDFNTEEFRLGSQRYQIDVELAGNVFVPFEVHSTREYTKPVAYTWDKSSGGDLELIHHSGQPVFRVDGQDGSVEFPLGLGGSIGPFSVGEDPSRAFSESLSSDPAAITDSDDPTAVSFLAGKGIDIHTQADVTLRNDTGTDVTENVTVSISLVGTGGDTDEEVTSETQSLTVTAGSETTETFLGSRFLLPNGEYRVEVTTTDLTVVETAEKTHGASYSWRKSETGQLQLADYEGNTLVSYGFRQGSPVEFQSGVQHTQRGDPTTDDLEDGGVMTYVSDGSGTGSAGDYVYAVNDGGTILTNIIAAKSNAT